MGLRSLSLSLFRTTLRFRICCSPKYWMWKVIQESNNNENVFPFSCWLTFCGFQRRQPNLTMLEGQCMETFQVHHRFINQEDDLWICVIIFHLNLAPLSTWVYRFIVALNEWNFRSLLSLSESINIDGSATAMTHKKTRLFDLKSFVYIVPWWPTFSLNYMCRARERNFSFAESFFKIGNYHNQTVPIFHRHVRSAETWIGVFYNERRAQAANV